MIRPIALALLACLSTQLAAAAESAAETEQALRTATQQLLDAIAPGEAAVWDRWLDPAVLQVDENDVVRGKAEMLKSCNRCPRAWWAT
jgi:hypothetical protein